MRRPLLACVLFGADAASAQATNHRVESISPASITISGFPCRSDQIDQVYSLQAQGNDRPAYLSIATRAVLWYGDAEGVGRWYIDSDTNHANGYFAYATTSSWNPPEYGWAEYCDDAWMTVEDATITAQMSDDACVALATAVLALPVCRDAVDGECSVGCGEIWIPSRDRCPGDQSYPFDTRRGAGLTPMCEAAMAPIVATAPRTMTLSGFTCHPAANGNFQLQSTTRNGRPHWKSGGMNLYWTPAYQNTGGAAWLVDEDLQPDHGSIYLISPSDSPSGSARWQEWCKTAWAQAHVTVRPSEPSGNWCGTALASLSNGLSETCCTNADSISCGQAGEPPTQCTVDCADMWAPYASTCPHGVDNLQGPLRSFFGRDCAAAADALAVLPSTSVSLTENDFHDFTFKAVSGVRYEVTVRVAEGDGSTITCPENLYDNAHGPGECDRLIEAGAITCTAGSTSPPSLAEGGQYAHFCDHACGFQCVNSGITSNVLYILPPGAHDNSQAVSSDFTTASDKGLAFTAGSTGRYTAKVVASAGAGDVSVYVNAVGTATRRAPDLIADGQEHPVSVVCEAVRCSFSYDGHAVNDGDGSSFDLKLVVQAGQSYAVRAGLGARESATQISATFYQDGAASGAAGFGSVVSGAMGSWTRTRPGHQNFAQSRGCTGFNDTLCTGLLGFGVHPGEVFLPELQGTWVAPSSGVVLMRITMSCDVPFYADVDLPGCTHTSTTYNCVANDDGSNNRHCRSELSLTVTPGAYYETESSSGGSSGSGGQLHVGTAGRTDTILMSRQVLEGLATTAMEGKAVTLEQMLVAGTPESNLMAEMFTASQEPYVVYPLSFDELSSGEFSEAQAAAGEEDGHRRQQEAGGPAAGLRVAVRTKATTEDGARHALEDYVEGLGALAEVPAGSGRRALGSLNATLLGEAGPAESLQCGELERQQRDALAAQQREIARLRAALAQAEARLAAGADGGAAGRT